MATEPGGVPSPFPTSFLPDSQKSQWFIDPLLKVKHFVGLDVYPSKIEGCGWDSPRSYWVNHCPPPSRTPQLAVQRNCRPRAETCGLQTSASIASSKMTEVENLQTRSKYTAFGKKESTQLLWQGSLAICLQNFSFPRGLKPGEPGEWRCSAV